MPDTDTSGYNHRGHVLPSLVLSDGHTAMTWARSVRWLFLYPVLVLGGLHMLMTGSPIPLWHFEQLDAPVHVRSITAESLLLEDGRTVALPFIEEIPHDNPLFQAAVSDGIEITTGGEAYGLMWLDRNCGNDPVVWRRMRVNLSDLAGALHPAGIDSSIVHPEVIALIGEHYRIGLSEPSRSRRNARLTVWDQSKMQTIRRQFEHSAGLLEETNANND